MVYFLVVGLFAFFVVYLLIPVTKRIAIQLGVVDQPNARKIHRAPIPLSGGLAIYIGAMLTLFLFFETTSLHFVLAWGGFILLSLGLVDDWFKSQGKDFPAWPKLIGQVGSAVFAYLLGIRFFGLGEFWTGGGLYVFPAWLSLLATVFWIVGFINMINFLDGMDGLAGGITAISSMTLFTISILRGQQDVAILAVIIIGASLAFLKHNFHPASVFLGDAGSMFLGYTIGVTSLYGAMKSATVATFIIIILALGVPVFDTIQVILTRIRAGSPIYKADRRHVHHRLLSNGLTQRQAVMVIYAMGIGFSILSLLLFLYIG
ncbi:MraY family glycosyltransferase [Ammoniphilus sp. CFH 90114]|uniref:MraY family glycosyltransferase n=1 Tax=Ammoniphilus sp. CFH 90114 TaxID=2493665 RepID=UPI00100F8AEA|nr:MraY family glycosyltransferase [Ammoniphilus sp. CFH 90114]RXT04940.1 undecaprenyl/decaprenyl-phosphate alpha-N-acetylglucosaminyl 1-phosphate transferase [Ammoniphilus sp. CFH 90114]